MKLFLDTAHIPSVEKWAALGILDGVTTNPTLMSKEGGDPLAIIHKICDLLPDGDISVEVTELDPRAVHEQALRIADIAENVVVKIPCAPQYYKTIAYLADHGIPVNITLVFSLTQALVMSKLGVYYISPFVGRLDETGVDGIQMLRDMRAMIDAYGYETEILAASIRSVEKFEQAIQAAPDCITLPVPVLEQAVEHPLTKAGIEKFIADWKKLTIARFP